MASHKTEIVTIRLPRELHEAVRVAAHLERRSISNFIEVVLASSVETISFDGDESVAAAVTAVFDPRPEVALVNRALDKPKLLGADERFIWQLIKETPDFWKSKTGGTARTNLDMERLSKDWNALQERRKQELG
jgi:uncharacterized protein (DUF1778 family)